MDVETFDIGYAINEHAVGGVMPRVPTHEWLAVGGLACGLACGGYSVDNVVDDSAYGSADVSIVNTVGTEDGANTANTANTTYTGGVTKYYNDHDKPAEKDSIMVKLLGNKIPECIGERVNGHCMSLTTLKKVDNIIGKLEKNGETGGKDVAILASTASVVEKNKQIIDRAKQALNCGDEMCILNSLKDELGHALVNGEISTNFKLKGPTDNKLLSNINTDAVLRMYAKIFPGFYPYNFNMRNYASYRYKDGYIENTPDSLAVIQFKDLYASGYKCCGCIINDDTYQGPGTHWMALFADARGSQWTVEFFNSSAKAPKPEWVNWMVKTRGFMEDILDASKQNVSNASNIQKQRSDTARPLGLKTEAEIKEWCCEELTANTKVTMVCCSEIRHQQSKTECGLYSLFYIFARLYGIPYDYFLKNPVPDQLMFEFRQILFNGEKGVVDGKFDWNLFRSQVSVKWE